MMSKGVIITGMHRSGTSAFAGALAKAGMNFGEDLLPPLPENPKGFFEDREVVALNDAVLGTLGGRWDKLFRLPANWFEQKEFTTFEEKIRNFLERKFSQGDFAIKDPRLSITLPLFEKAMEGMGIQPCLIIVRRNDLEVARSLQKRNRFRLSHGLALSSFYRDALEKNVRGRDRFTVDHEAFFQDPLTLLEKVAGHFALPLKVEEHKDEIQQYLDDGLRHFSGQEENGKDPFSMGFVRFKAVLKKAYRTGKVF